MCNHEEDFCGVAKYKHHHTLMDKVVLGSIFLCLLGALSLIGITIFAPHLLACY